MSSTSPNEDFDSDVYDRLVFQLFDRAHDRIIAEGRVGPIRICDSRPRASERAGRAGHPSNPSTSRNVAAYYQAQAPDATFDAPNAVGASFEGPTSQQHRAGVHRSHPYISDAAVRSIRSRSRPTAPPSKFSSLQHDSGQSMSPRPPTANQPFNRTSPPKISKIIPRSGSIAGGDDVIVLGHNFSPYHHCVFGRNVAKTTFWNDGTLQCLLPPSMAPGSVSISVVSIGGVMGKCDDDEVPQWFEYIGHTELEP